MIRAVCGLLILICGSSAIAQEAEAVITGPKRVLYIEEPARVFFSGRLSTDRDGGHALRYEWSVEVSDASCSSETCKAEVRFPQASETTISFFGYGEYDVRLRVFDGEHLESPSESVLHRIALARPLGVGETPQFAAEQKVTVTELSSASLLSQVLLSYGSLVDLRFSIRGDVPPGLSIDERTGVVEWAPSLTDIGTHAFTVVASNQVGEASLPFEVRVLDETESVVSYGVTVDELPTDGSALEQLVNDSPALPRDALTLYRRLALGSGPEVIQEIETGEDRFVRLRFAPVDTPGMDGPFGGVFRSGASASRLVEAVLSSGQEFTIELWLSNVPESQPGASEDDPATIFALMARDGVAVNWLVGKNASGEMVLRSRGDAGGKLSIPANFLEDTPRHLVFVRKGGRLSAYVDGELEASVPQAGDLDWSDDHELVLGNTISMTRPFAGDVHYAGFYARALSAAHVRLLFRAGTEHTPQISPPSLQIHPDPIIIGRGSFILKAAKEAADIPALGKGDGDLLDCFDLLRPVRWEVSGLGIVGAEDLTSVACNAIPLGPCEEAVAVRFEPGPEAIDFEVEASVVQVPVRGITAIGRIEANKSIAPSEGPFFFKRGDVNEDCKVDISDGIFLLVFKFLGGSPPPCDDAADANDDGKLDLSDAVTIFSWLFVGGPPPGPPGPSSCGVDPTVDTLHCNRYTPCATP